MVIRHKNTAYKNKFLILLPYIKHFFLDVVPDIAFAGTPFSIILSESLQLSHSLPLYLRSSLIARTFSLSERWSKSTLAQLPSVEGTYTA